MALIRSSLLNFKSAKNGSLLILKWQLLTYPLTLRHIGARLSHVWTAKRGGDDTGIT